MATLIPAKGRIRNLSITPDFGRPDFSILQIQEIVGDTFVVIQAKHIGKGIYYVANEKGFENNLPLNVAASMESRTALYGDVLVARFEELGGGEKV